MDTAGTPLTLDAAVAEAKDIVTPKLAGSDGRAMAERLRVGSPARLAGAELAEGVM